MGLLQKVMKYLCFCHSEAVGYKWNIFFSLSKLKELKLAWRHVNVSTNNSIEINILNQVIIRLKIPGGQGSCVFIVLERVGLQG